MDGVTWVREGLVDVLVPTPFWATADFDIPIEQWRGQIAGPAKTTVLAAGAEILVRAYPAAKPIEQDITSTRGFAASSWQRGADAIYLFNYLDPAPMTGGAGDYRSLLQEGLGPDRIGGKTRRHVVTYRDTVAPGMPNEAHLPADGFAGGTFRVHIGPKPTDADGYVLVGLAPSESMKRARFKVAVNGADCGPAPDLDDLSLLSGVGRAGRYLCPVEALHEGYNEIRIRQAPGEPEQKVVWIELRIQPVPALAPGH
jgi:hypothetical protein